MIIDAHAHVFPPYGGPHGDLVFEQNDVPLDWGKRPQATLDRKYIPEPGEDVGFRAGKYGKFHWTKYDKECWYRRFSPILVEMEWPPEQLIEFMDEIGVDKAILQAGYMEINYCREYFADCMKKFPGRFIGTIGLDYDIEKSEEYREVELKKLRDSVYKMNMKGVFHGYPIEQDITDDKFEPLWEELARLKIPHIFCPGVGQTKGNYLKSLDLIEKTLKKHPSLNGIIGHLGGFLHPPSHQNYTGTPQELMKLLRLPNAYFEVGYVLAYEQRDWWKENYEYPFPLHTKLIKTVYDEVGAERLLWGSDIPNNYRVCTYLQCLDSVRLHFDFLSEEEKNLVLGVNAAKLFRV